MQNFPQAWINYISLQRIGVSQKACQNFNNSCTGIFKAFAILLIVLRVGFLLPVSIATTVLTSTLIISARSSCDSPFSFRIFLVFSPNFWLIIGLLDKI